MKVLLAGGGTGGHVYPAIAIGQNMIDLFDADVAYVGNEDSFESTAIDKLGWAFYPINISGLRRSLSLENLFFPFKIIASLLSSRKIIEKFKPDVVVGTGGYVSGPPLFVAAKMGIPTAIQEQNSFPGLTSRILSRYVDLIFLGFEEAVKFFPAKKCRYTGNPLRTTIKPGHKDDSKASYQMRDYSKVILVFGGSQGSHSININFARVIPELMDKRDLGIIWQTGKAGYRKYFDKYSACPNIKIIPFIDNMSAAYGASDWAITRAGALTLAELSAVGLPSILIPYPHATNNHQMYNARNYESAKAAFVIVDKGDYSGLLLKKINDFYGDSIKRIEMSTRIRDFAAPEAAQNIASALQTLLKGSP